MKRPNRLLGRIARRDLASGQARAPATDIGSPEVLAALERDELMLHFQPIVDLRSGECRRAEALVRWLHPRVGSIGARWIVELAERERILPALMRWAIARAERQRAEWALAGLEIAPSINLAGVEIDDDALAIRAALHDCAARPSGYTFDVPASIQADRNVALERLRALGRTGARVALDGVEESDLPSRTVAMHLDEIKIARSLILRAASDGMAATGVRRIIEAARDRGLVTVAIGVEDAATARFLRAAGCDLAQGFYMSRPLANAEVARWHGWIARLALSGTAAVSGYLGPIRPASDAPPVTRAASMPLAGPSCCVLPATATPRDLGIALVTFDAGGSAVVAEASLAKADVARVTDAVSRDVIAIQRSLGVPFSHAPTVYVLATRASFAFALQRGFGQPATGAGALASSNGGVAFPSEGAVLINYENVKGDASLAIVRHELAHLLAHQIAGPDADLPAWFDEGLATLLEREVSSDAVQDERSRSATMTLLRRGDASLQDLSSARDWTIRNAALGGGGYTLAAAGVQVLREDLGTTGITSLLQRTRSVGFAQAFGEATGGSVTDFTNAFPGRFAVAHGGLQLVHVPSGDAVKWAVAGLGANAKAQVTIDGRSYHLAFEVTADSDGMYSAMFGGTASPGAYTITVVGASGSASTNVVIGGH